MRITICDDDMDFAQTIQEFCTEMVKTEGMDKVQICYVPSGEELIRQEKKSDILLLDIEMDGMSGIDVKENLKNRWQDTKILFLTSHTEYMKEAFGKNVYGYVEKRNYQNLGKYLAELLQEYQKEQKKLLVQDGDLKRVVKVGDILYIEAERNYVQIHTERGIYSIWKSLKECEEELTKHGFYRIQRSVLINLEYLNAVTEKEVTMSNGEKLGISRGTCRKIKTAYQEFQWQQS